MALSFSHATKLISVPQVDAAPLLVQTLLNAIRAEEASARGITYSKIADASGKAALGGGVVTGITLALLSTWKVDFAAGAYQATIDGGNLADALNRVNNTGSPQVLVLSSAAATLVETGTSGLTAGESALLAGIADVPTAAENADAAVAAMNANPPGVNVKKVNDVPITGAGVTGNHWRPA